MKNKILMYVGIGLAAIVIIILVALTGSGRLFQGALYNLRPIYTSCKIEGQKFNSNNLDDCEHFYEKFQKGTFPDGEYTVFTTYTDKKLNQGIIPVSIKGQELSCNFTTTGYQPVVNILDAANTLGSQTIKSTSEVPVGSNGIIAQINYSKNSQVYPYDTNICEGAFQAQVTDGNKAPLGTALLDHNGFINSRPLVNEVLITNRPYYSDANSNIVKSFTPGNIYASLNAAPDLTFKFAIECSSNFPQVTIAPISTSTDTSMVFQGLSTQFLNTCASKLYLSFQNANGFNDIQIVNPIKVNSVGDNAASYDLKLASLSRINDKNTTFPFIYTVQLLLRDRTDVSQAVTLGKGVLTVTNYTPIIYPSSNSADSANSATQTSATTATEEAASTEVKMTPANTEAAQMTEIQKNMTATPMETNTMLNKSMTATPVMENKTMTATPVAETQAATALPAVTPVAAPVAVEMVKVRRSPEKLLVLPKAETPIASIPTPPQKSIAAPVAAPTPSDSSSDNTSTDAPPTT